MGEDFAQKFQEIFHCQVKGEDIAEARFNAWTALDMAIGDKIPRHHWKLSQMQHELQVGEDEEGKPIAFVACEAVWIYDPESDGDGGKHAMLLGSGNLDPDGVEEEKPELHLVEND